MGGEALLKQLLKMLKMYGLTIVLCIPMIAFGVGIVSLGMSTWLREMSPNLTGIVGLSVLVGMLLVTILIYRLNAKGFKKLIITIANLYDEHMTEKSARNLKIINHYILDKNYYSGRTIKYRELSPTNGAILISINILIYLFSLGVYKYSIIIIFVPILSALIYNYCFRTITISESGIFGKSWFRKTFIKWDQVHSVGVTTAYCYVSKNKFSEKRVVRRNKNTITFTYRSKIIHHIYAYWDGEIIDLEFKKAWRKYLKKHAELKETQQ
mgnify:CR=1 FL=1